MLIGPQTLLVARYMDLLVARQKLTAANIANADTPGYLARGIDFRAEMRRALDDPTRAPTPPAVHVVGLGAVKNDGNDVNLDRELQMLAETGIRYNMAALMLRNKLRSLHSVIQEGRGG